MTTRPSDFGGGARPQAMRFAPCFNSTGIADGVSYTIPLTWTSGQTALTIGNTLSVTGVVTTMQNHNVLLIVGSQPLAQATHWFHPFSVSLGDGVVWTGIVLRVADTDGNQTVTLDTGAPATVTALAVAAINVGVRLAAADVGKIVSFGYGGSASGSYTGTISAVTGVNTVTMATAITFDFPIFYDGDVPMQMALGTDNYAALTAGVSAALAAGIVMLECDGSYLVTKVPAGIGRVLIRGDGRIINISQATDNASPSWIDRPVVPWAAPPPPPKPNRVPKSVMARLSGKSTVTGLFIGASTFSEDSGGAAMSTSVVRHIENEFQSRNPGVEFKWTRYVQGGACMRQYVGWDSPYTGGWYPGSGLWVGNATNPGYAYTAAPDLLIIEWSANDVPATSNVTAFMALIAMIKNWPRPPAIIVVYDPYQALGAGGIENEWYDRWGTHLGALCTLLGVGYIDLRSPLVMSRNGYDPRHSVLERVPPPNTVVTGYNPTHYNVCGYHLGWYYIGTSLAFWTAMGGMVSAPMLNDNTWNNTTYQNNFIVGYDRAEGYPGAPSAMPDAIWMRADLGSQLPGAALYGGTTVRLYGSYTMLAASNQITYAPYSSGPANAWTNADNGEVVTVVGAGSPSTEAAANVRATPVQAGGMATGHLVGFAKYIDGTTLQIFADAGLTTPLNAVTAITGLSFGVLFGSPRVYSAITGIAAGANGVQALQISMRDNEAALTFGSNHGTFRRILAQPGALPGPLTLTFAGNPNFPWYTNSDGLPYFYIAKPRPHATRFFYAPSETDDTITGSATFNDGALPTGGSGGNHPSELFNRFAVRALSGVDLTIP